MGIYEKNDEHRALFGDLVNGGKWTAGAWIRKGSNVDQTKDLTLFAGGTNGQVASKRFDLLLLDDILGEENTATLDQREKVKDWWDKTLYPRLVAVSSVIGKGVTIAYGTRWAKGDMYEVLMSPIVPDEPDVEPGYGFRTIVRKALITPDPHQPSTWSSYWEEVWPLEDLLKRRARNRSKFDAVYQNDVSGLLDGDIFRADWIQYYGTPEGDPSLELDEHLRRHKLEPGFTTRIGVDLAFSLATRADFTTAVTTSEDRVGNFYVQRAERTKIDVGHDDFIIEAYDATPGVGLVVIEAVQAQSLVVTQMMRDHPRIPVMSRPVDNDKVTRATAVAERWKGGKVWLHASLRDSEFVREHLAFANPPKGHDDYVDAGGHSMMLGGNDFLFGGVSVRR
jgi:phage terminase large subunit-like protein